MAVSNRENIRRLLVSLLTGTAACAYLVYAPVAHAQAPKISAPEGSKLLLAANELVYNKDQQLVTATGGVQINYAGYRMVAQKVQYNQQTGRVLASGNIEMIEPEGNRIYAESLDVTDSFSEGFVNSLRVETPDNTRMAAETGERLPGDLMVLNNGVYTACLPCATRKNGAPLWQVKAERVVQNGQTHTVRLENAKFELFGVPLAFIPVLEIPDNTVKRKSGFLFPTMSMSQKLGFGLGIPYYYVINNHMDATLTTTGYTNQGVLLDAEVRNRFETGDHTLRVAHINQMTPDAFTTGTSDSLEEGRSMVASKGDFKINPRWSFGWNVMLQTDNNFARTYDLPGYKSDTFRNEVYLTGMGKRNYFDLRSFYFDKQDSDKDSNSEKRQAIVYPTLDYNYTAPRPVAGGELTVNTNFVNISRDKFDYYTEGTTTPSTRIRGLEGQYSRLTSEAEWKRTFTMPSGLLLTPILAARGDGMRMNMTSPDVYSSEYTDKDSAGRYMLTAGLEARYPVLITTDNTTQVIEPIAQIYARPNEQMAGQLPNEDSQSFVFDATNLFERDKFSGYDRVEGGTRANVGVRYSGSFGNNVNLRGIVGQSFQLGGENSFAADDLVNAGANSGLEDSASDYVGMAAIDLPNNRVSLSTSLRVDNKSLELNRSDTAVTYGGDRFQSSLIYTQIAPQPEYGIVKNNELASVTGNLRINTNWSVFGSATYDINNAALTRRGGGISYSDECTIFTLGYSDYRDVNNEAASDWAITARLSFRTLGDINIGSADLANAANN